MKRQENKSPVHRRNLAIPRILTALSIALTVALVSLPTQIFAQQDVYPFLGKINVKSVHLRAGQSKNFESLGQVREGDAVVVIEKDYSWYKVRLPKDAKSYITNDYVTMISSRVGEVTADRVNVRAGAGINHTVLGQVNEGDRVLITESKEEWLRIHPVPSTYGWIKEDFVDFVSADVEDEAYMSDTQLAVLEKEIEQIAKKTAGAATKMEASTEDVGAQKDAAAVTIQTSFKGVLTKSSQSQE
ncbi:MAG: SH3 domain-containing protein, partial [Candidatus Omnitrophica bacterium]|nr:SH3 domain-containing protein [Candidatus Omnitrophota bacterium]